MPGCTVVWLAPVPRSSCGRSALTTTSGVPAWWASSTAGCRLATAVPDVVTTATGCTGAAGQPEGEEPGAALVDPHVQPQPPGPLGSEHGVGQRGRPGAGAEHDLADAVPDQLVDEHGRQRLGRVHGGKSATAGAATTRAVAGASGSACRVVVTQHAHRHPPESGDVRDHPGSGLPAHTRVRVLSGVAPAAPPSRRHARRPAPTPSGPAGRAPRLPTPARRRGRRRCRVGAPRRPAGWRRSPRAGGARRSTGGPVPGVRTVTHDGRSGLGVRSSRGTGSSPRSTDSTRGRRAAPGTARPVTRWSRRG